MRRSLRRGGALATLATASLIATLGLQAAPALAATTAQVKNGTLKVTGDNAANPISVNLAFGAPNVLQVDVGEDGTADFSFDRSTFTAVEIDGGGGNDDLRVSNGGGVITDEAITLNGGTGNDTLIGGAGNETLIGGKGDDFADGNIGSDVMLLGAGNDTGQWDPGDGSDTVDGQGGRDLLQFNGSNAAEHVDISANGTRVRLFRDVAAITMDIDGMETIDYHALGSPDTLTVGDLTGTHTTSVVADLAGFDGLGDGSADTVNLIGTPGADHASVGNAADGSLEVTGLSPKLTVRGGEPAMDTVGVLSVAGNDTLTYPLGVTGSTQVSFDGGPDTDTTDVVGTAGDDTVGVARNGTAAATFTPTGLVVNTQPTVENLDIAGLGGNDTMIGQNGIGTITSLTMDGGPGNDTLAGGDGNDHLIGGIGNDHVDGNIGFDSVDLGGGNDTFQWDPGDSSDVVEGGAGTDTLAFNGSNAAERIELSANGSRVRLTRDVAAITMDLNGFEAANVRLLGSPDDFTVDDLTGTGLKNVAVDLAGFDGLGDAAADTVVVNGTGGPDHVHASAFGSVVTVAGLAAKTQITGAEPANDALAILTGAGNDDVTVDPSVNALLTPIIDLGTDE